MKALSFFFSTALLLPGIVLAEPVPVESFSRAEFNTVATQLENLVSSEGLGNCPPVFFRIKSQNRQEDLTLQDEMNELISRISPSGMSYVFGLMVNLELNHERIRNAFLSMSESPSPELSIKLESASLAVLHLTTKGELGVQAGLGHFASVIEGVTKSNADIKLRTIMDYDNNEFLVFGVGSCKGI